MLIFQALCLPIFVYHQKKTEKLEHFQVSKFMHFTSLTCKYFSLQFISLHVFHQTPSFIQTLDLD